MAIPDATVPAPADEWIEPADPEWERPAGAAGPNRLQRALAGVLPEDMWGRRPPRADPPQPETETHDQADDAEAGLYEPSGKGVSTASTDAALRGKPSKATRELCAGITTALAAAAGGVANMVAQDDEDDPVWLMTEDEANGIGGPLGSMIARRAPALDGAGDTSDLIDGFGALLNLAVYTIRNLTERRARRRALRQIAPLQDAQAA